MNPKAAQLDHLMRDIAACNLCCQSGGGIASNKLLRNLITEFPELPRYGGIPSMYTDWRYRLRLDAKIAVVLQDWGGVEPAQMLRAEYLNRQRKGRSEEEAWRSTVRPRPEDLSGNTHKNLIRFLSESAGLEGIPWLDYYLDHIYFTNAILCFQQGVGSRQSQTIDLPRSIENCCHKQRFLYRQLVTVKPDVVLALGKRSLEALDIHGRMEDLVEEANRARHHCRAINYKGQLRLRVVPAFHPAASRSGQVNDYRNLWRALRAVTGREGRELADICFPTSTKRVFEGFP